MNEHKKDLIGIFVGIILTLINNPIIHSSIDYFFNGNRHSVNKLMKAMSTTILENGMYNFLSLLSMFGTLIVIIYVFKMWIGSMIKPKVAEEPKAEEDEDYYR
ncbi:MAG: hypothetical protein ATN36_01735 [Epulopiscium sp. Nele67-Bin005]|nr:MAG: hypothetical protein ATN36_01735 [Epulopiscium sp. Nele67-Bin005]